MRSPQQSQIAAPALTRKITTATTIMDPCHGRKRRPCQQTSKTWRGASATRLACTSPWARTDYYYYYYHYHYHYHYHYYYYYYYYFDDDDDYYYNYY